MYVQFLEIQLYGDLFENVLLAGKAGAKGADAKKIVKKSAVAKPNTIKSLFMNSNVKRPAEVCFAHTCLLVSPVLILT